MHRQGQILEDEPDTVAVPFVNLLESLLRPTAVRALEVGVLDQGHRGIHRSSCRVVRLDDRFDPRRLQENFDPGLRLQTPLKIRSGLLATLLLEVVDDLLAGLFVVLGQPGSILLHHLLDLGFVGLGHDEILRQPLVGGHSGLCRRLGNQLIKDLGIEHLHFGVVHLLAQFHQGRSGVGLQIAGGDLGVTDTRHDGRTGVVLRRIVPGAGGTGGSRQCYENH